LATPREIRRRIRSVRNISKVTRAMEMVAAAKMRRAQTQALSLRPYATKAWDLLVHLAAQRGASQELHPLLVDRPAVARVGLVLITSSKGLCGGYNHNIIRQSLEFVREARVPVDVVTVGRVGRNAMSRAGMHIVADFDNLADQPGLNEIRPIATVIQQDFLAGDFDEVFLAYTDFVNTMVQKPRIRRLLPLRHRIVNEMDEAHLGLQMSAPEESERALIEYLYEPSLEEVLGTVLPRFTELQVYEAILESAASEHSARMVAMRAATDNARQLISDLTLTYNQVRQSAITREILDIVGGVEALAKAGQRQAG
jgi:F-type H+-transporting ATPase subunit gamma